MSDTPHPTPASATSSNPTDEPDKGELLAYGSTTIASDLTSEPCARMVVPVLNIGLGFNPALAGSLGMIRLLWDSFTDPLMGYFSDNFKSRWGRRRPLILVGGLLMAITASLIWTFPRGASENFTMAYILVALLAFTTSQTIFNVPYGALGMEMSRSYNGRTRVVLYRSFFQKAGYFITPWLFPLVSLAIFTDVLQGVRILTSVLGIMLVLAVINCFRCTHERTITPPSRPRTGFFKSMWAIASSIHFIRVTYVYVVMLFLIGFYYLFGMYICIYHLFDGDVTVGSTHWAGVNTVGNGLALVSIPLVGWFAKKYGKHVALKVSMAMMAIGSLLFFVCMNPTYPYLIYIVPVFYSTSNSAIFIILPSLLADVIDVDDLAHGERREGLFAASASYFMKIAYAIANGLSGLTLVLVGFNADLGSAQPEGTMLAMKMVFSFLPIVLLGTAFLLLRNYPITEAYITEVQAKLKARNEAQTT